eukprot:6813651-Alexandrium_andersonii.AAC.1
MKLGRVTDGLGPFPFQRTAFQLAVGPDGCTGRKTAIGALRKSKATIGVHTRRLGGPFLAMVAARELKLRVEAHHTLRQLAE